MSRFTTLIALALTAAVVAASVASANSGGAEAKVDPLAVGYLSGRGLSPSEVQSWTVGACSQENRPASCYAALDRTSAPAAKVDPLAVGYLMGRGLTPSEVKAWTVGICSHAAKPSLCYAPFERTAASASPPTQVGQSDGFSWGDAGIGAGMAMGLALVLGGVGATLLVTRHNRQRHAQA